MPMPYLPDPIVRDLSLASKFARLHQTLSGTAPQLEQDTRLLSVLSRLITRCAQPPPKCAVPSPSRAVFRARDYLAAHCEEDVSLTALARIAGLSEYHFCRAFGATVGMPPHQYQLQARIHCAKRLIVAGMPLAQIATQVGFAQQSHFGWHFKRLVGVTPGQYAHND